MRGALWLVFLSTALIVAFRDYRGFEEEVEE